MATSKKRLGTISEPLQPLAIDIDELHPDPANARKHNVKNIDAIKASLHAYGQRKPVVVQRQGMIVRAGNGTLEAAKALGWTHLAAVVIDEDNATASQFAIADNRTGELAEWDDETLASLLDGMDDETRNLLAFDEGDMHAILRSFDVDATDPPDLDSGDRKPHRQMSFILHDSQHATVEKALRRAADAGVVSDLNKNGNGNCLAHICEAYLHG
jgi:ParB-like chromosome segregation protein Spo0J